MASDIEWTDETWNPILGCKEYSPGCRNCYAAKFTHRGLSPRHKGLTVLRADGPHFNGEHRFQPDVLDKPLHWKKPRRIFVCSMSDLFRDAVSNEEIAAVFGVMSATPHTYQVLTKRADRLPKFFEWMAQHEDETAATPMEQCLMRAADYVAGPAWDRALEQAGITEDYMWAHDEDRWPLPNVWIGVSVEDQQRAEERIPHLLKTPAAVRFVSYEPALGPVDFSRWLACRGCGNPTPCMPEHDAGINWLIVGGESGPSARPFDLAWARSTIAQCKAAGVPCFVKQMGSDWAAFNRIKNAMAENRKGGDMAEWPVDLRVREWPR